MFDLLRSRLFFCLAACSLPVLAAAQPAISSGQILGTTVNVGKPAASPLIEIDATGGGTAVVFTYRGPSQQLLYQFYQMPSGPGFGKHTLLQGYLSPIGASSPFQLAFSPYSQPGIWTLIGAQICTAHAAACSYYEEAQIPALFPVATFTLVNPNKIDTTAPFPQKASILTPDISLRRGGEFRALVQASDDVSGVLQVTACLNGPAGFTPACASSDAALRPALHGQFAIRYQLPDTAPAGIYMVTSLELSDIAGNMITLSNPGQLGPLFGGSASFTVSP